MYHFCENPLPLDEDFNIIMSEIVFEVSLHVTCL